MNTTQRPGATPGRVAVVGAGMVGLTTAWFLQEHGIEVTVLDGRGVAGGASWGNAGWLTPGIAAPLPEAAVVRYGLRAVLNPRAPVYVPPRLDPRLWGFLAGFVRRSTTRQWMRAMRALVPLNALALESFDLLGAGGVDGALHPAQPLLVVYRTERQRQALLREIEHIRAAGQDLRFDLLTGEQARTIEPALSHAIGAGVSLPGQYFVDPGEYLHALARSVRKRGGTIAAGLMVTDVRESGGAVHLATTDGEEHGYDAVVLATGAWLGDLARRFGVRAIVQAGRGYSFSVTGERIPTSPLYFPAVRVACTPLGGRLRIAGMMEFDRPDAPLDPRRIDAITEAVRPLLDGVALDDRADEWVGSRPCTTDGLPLVGATRSPRVHAAGGHGMWGITLGPATGRLLAEQIVTGRPVAALAPFDPLR